VTRIVCVLALLVCAAGCGSSDPAPATPDPAAKNRPLPPEVEHDPETATKMYQKAKKTRQK
jgi:hypothetical protein